MERVEVGPKPNPPQAGSLDSVRSDAKRETGHAENGPIGPSYNQKTMRIPFLRQKADKTWSQQLLSIKLRVGHLHTPAVFSWERQRLLIHAAKTALAAALCWYLALHFGLHEGYWGPISAIIVLQSNMGATVTASRDRLLGTLIGAVLGFSFSLFSTLPWNYILAVLAAVIVCGLLGLRSSSRLAGVTITIIMLVQKTGSRSDLALDRVGEVVLGIVVALAVTTLVLPDRARLRLRDGLAQEFLVLGAFFEAIMQGFRGAPADNLHALREVALEFSVKDTDEYGYAQQLEPALGKLTVDILTGFHHVASRIHEWRFQVPPQMSLEEDIADLEARLTAVRPTGIGFSQAEILRAYAVQLHLKQLARLLRASRVETSRAIGETQE